LHSKVPSYTGSHNASGSESESVREQLTKKRSVDYTDEEKKNLKYKSSSKPSGMSDSEDRSNHNQNTLTRKEKLIEEVYSSSVGSTKDRDNSQSSSVNSKTENDSNVSLCLSLL
jgi:hypothetical protein